MANAIDVKIKNGIPEHREIVVLRDGEIHEVDDPECVNEDAVLEVRPPVAEPIAESIPMPCKIIDKSPTERHVKFIESNEIIEIPNRYGNSANEVPVDYHDVPFRFPAQESIEIPIEIEIAIETPGQIARKVLIAKNMAASERMRLRHAAIRAAKAAVPQPPAPVSSLLFPAHAFPVKVASAFRTRFARFLGACPMAPAMPCINPLIISLVLLARFLVLVVLVLLVVAHMYMLIVVFLMALWLGRRLGAESLIFLKLSVPMTVPLEILLMNLVLMFVD